MGLDRFQGWSWCGAETASGLWCAMCVGTRPLTDQPPSRGVPPAPICEIGGLPATGWGFPPSHLLGHWSGGWFPLQVQPSLITGHPCDRPQFPGHLLRRRWSLQYCSPLGVAVAQFLGQLASFPFEVRFQDLPFWDGLPLDHWFCAGDHAGLVLPLPFVCSVFGLVVFGVSHTHLSARRECQPSGLPWPL